MAIQSIPHGWYSIFPMVLTTVGWLFGLFQDGCDFVRVEGEIVSKIASQPNAPYLEAGRNAYREPYYNARTDSWHTEYIGSCLVYPEEEVEIDMWWNVAKGFDFASLVLGGTCSLFLWFSACCVFSRGTWRLAGAQVLLACFFQAASFLWFKTELCQTNECSLFWGSKSDIAACCCWLLAAVLIFCHYPVPKNHLDRLGSHDTADGDGLMIGPTSAPELRVSSAQIGAGYDDPIATATPEPLSQGSEMKQGDLEDGSAQWYSPTQTGQQSGEGSEQGGRSDNNSTPAQIV